MANPETSSSQPDEKKYMSVKFPDDPETTAVLKELDRVVLNCANDGADKLKIPPKDANRRSPPLPRDPKDVDPEEVEIVMNQSGCSREQAILALLKHGNMVDAILDLTP